MKLEDYQDYQNNNVKASKSQLKEYIQIYADMAKKLKSEDAIELEAVKRNIRDTYPTEIYFTLIDEAEKPVKLTLTETSREYIIPIFTDMREYAVGSAKISKLFLDKLDLKVITPEDISELAEADECFQGFVINPHSQNFNMDRNGDFQMYICPTIGEDHEKDFLVTGSLDDFKIIAFSNMDEYEKGFEYLELVDYKPTEVSDELFSELAKNDDAFSGLILNIHSENKIITKEELFL